MKITILHPKATLDHLGLIPSFLSENDIRPAREQFDANYCGGWNPMPKFTLKGHVLRYPQDPPYHAVAKIDLRNETILIFDHAIVAIVQSDGRFEACRMD